MGRGSLLSAGVPKLWSQLPLVKEDGCRVRGFFLFQFHTLSISFFCSRWMTNFFLCEMPDALLIRPNNFPNRTLMAILACRDNQARHCLGHVLAPSDVGIPNPNQTRALMNTAGFPSFCKMLPRTGRSPQAHPYARDLTFPSLAALDGHQRNPGCDTPSPTTVTLKLTGASSSNRLLPSTATPFRCSFDLFFLPIFSTIIISNTFPWQHPPDVAEGFL